MSRFQSTTLAAIYAIREEPGDELAQLRAIQEWEGVRAEVRALTQSEQRIAVETLRDRKFPTTALGDEIASFLAMKDRDGLQLDEELSGLTLSNN